MVGQLVVKSVDKTAAQKVALSAAVSVVQWASLKVEKMAHWKVHLMVQQLE